MLIEHAGMRPHVHESAYVAPDRHDEIWAIQRELGFPKEAFGIERPPPGETIMPEAMRLYSERFGAHLGDRLVEG